MRETNACRGDASGQEQQEQKKGVEESVSFSPCRETLLVAVVVVCHVLRFCLCWWRMRVQGSVSPRGVREYGEESVQKASVYRLPMQSSFHSSLSSTAE